MPADPQQISGILSILNEVNVKKGVFKQFEEGTLALDIVEKGDQNSPGMADMLAEVDGRYVQIHAHTDGNPNVAKGVSEREGYGRPGSQGYGVLKYRCVRMVSSLAETTEAASRSDTTAQAVFRVAARETEALIANTRRRENKYILGDGSGLFATAGSATSWGDTEKTLTVDDVSNFAVGMEVAVRHKTAGTAPTGWTTAAKGGFTTMYPALITAIDPSTKKLTLIYYDGTTDISMNTDATNDMGVYPHDVQGKVPWGLDNVCSTVNPQNNGFDPDSLGTDAVGMSQGFGGVDRATATWFQANPTTALGNVPLSIKDHIEPLEVTLIGRDTTLIGQDSIMSLSDGAGYYQVIHGLEAAKRTFERTKIITGKYDVVRSGIFTFGWDPMVTSGTHLFFAPKYLFRMLLKEWQFETRAGGKWAQATDAIGRPTGEWQANLESEKQFLCASCRPCAKFTGGYRQAA